MARPFMVAIWSRPFSKKPNRAPDQNLMHLRDTVGKFDARIRPKGEVFDKPLEMQCLFVAPEYYFARSFREASGADQVSGDFATRIDPTTSVFTPSICERRR